MNRLIIVGSPRIDGRSAALGDLLFESCIAECPEDEVSLAPVSTLDIAGCTACNACKAFAEGADPAPYASCHPEQAGDPSCHPERAGDPSCHPERAQRAEGSPQPSNAPTARSAADAADPADTPRCIIDDDMQELYPLIDDADELIIVAPVFFAGASSQLKALLDRFQPYFWTDARHGAPRPATLHIIGEGNDPFGYAPLIGTVRSALSVAGFRLERILDWVGKIDGSGEIIADADELPVDFTAPASALGPFHAASAPAVHAIPGGKAGNASPCGGKPAFPLADEDAFANVPAARPASTSRAKLNLGANGAERQVIRLDDDGKRIDACQGRKRASERRDASAKRGTSGTAKPKGKGGAPYGGKPKGGASHGGGPKGNAPRGGNPRGGKPSGSGPRGKRRG